MHLLRKRSGQYDSLLLSSGNYSRASFEAGTKLRLTAAQRQSHSVICGNIITWREQFSR